MIKHIAFTVYPVTDMARARRFYEEVLGLRMARREAHEFEWVEYDLDGVTFALTNVTGGGGPAPMQAVASPSKSRTSTRRSSNCARRECV